MERFNCTKTTKKADNVAWERRYHVSGYSRAISIKLWQSFNWSVFCCCWYLSTWGFIKNPMHRTHIKHIAIKILPIVSFTNVADICPNNPKRLQINRKSLITNPSASQTNRKNPAHRIMAETQTASSALKRIEKRLPHSSLHARYFSARRRILALFSHKNNVTAPKYQMAVPINIYPFWGAFSFMYPGSIFIIHGPVEQHLLDRPRDSSTINEDMNILFIFCFSSFYARSPGDGPLLLYNVQRTM